MAASSRTCSVNDKPGVRHCPPPPPKPVIGPPSKTPRTDAEICMYPARLPVISWGTYLGFEPVNHWFVRTKDFARGMQAKGFAGPFFKDVVKDQTWDLKAGTQCVDPATINPKWRHIDTECLDREFALGKDLGRWTPVVNDCHSAVAEALDKCALSEPVYQTRALTNDLSNANADLDQAISRLESAVEKAKLSSHM